MRKVIVSFISILVLGVLVLAGGGQAFASPAPSVSPSPTPVAETDCQPPQGIPGDYVKKFCESQANAQAQRAEQAAAESQADADRIAALDPNTKVEIPAPSLVWLSADETWGSQGGVAAGWLEGLASGVIGVGFVIAVIAFIGGVLGWVASRNGLGFGGQDQHFFASRAGIALIGAALLGSVGAAVAYGMGLIGGISM